MKNILILGTHGQNNIGDELLLQSFVHVFKKDFKLVTNSYQPELTAKQFGIKTFNTSSQVYKIPYYILKSNAVIFAGGNIVKELYTAYGGNKYSVLLKLVFVLIISKIFWKKTYLSNIGIGPVESKFGKFLAKIIIKFSTQVTVRDRASHNIAKQLGFDLELLPDAAFIFEKDDLKKNDSLKGNQTKIALNLCRNIADPNSWESFMNQLEKTIISIHEKNPNIEIVGIPMQSDFVSNDDYITLEDFKYRLVGKIPNIKFSISKPKDVYEVAKLLIDCDYSLVTRLHLGILCTILYIPFLIFKYDIKIDGYLESFNIKDLGINIFDSNEISYTSKIDYLAENILDIKKRLSSIQNKNYLKNKEYFNLFKSLL